MILLANPIVWTFISMQNGITTSGLQPLASFLSEFAMLPYLLDHQPPTLKAKQIPNCEGILHPIVNRLKLSSARLGSKCCIFVILKSNFNFGAISQRGASVHISPLHDNLQASFVSTVYSAKRLHDKRVPWHGVSRPLYRISPISQSSTLAVA